MQDKQLEGREGTNWYKNAQIRALVKDLKKEQGVELKTSLADLVELDKEENGYNNITPQVAWDVLKAGLASGLHQ